MNFEARYFTSSCQSIQRCVCVHLCVYTCSTSTSVYARECHISAVRPLFFYSSGSHNSPFHSRPQLTRGKLTTQPSSRIFEYSIIMYSNYICHCLICTHADRQGVHISFTVCLFVCLFVYTVTDFSAEDKASGVKLCSAVHRRAGHFDTHFGKLLPRSPKSDEWASA